ncbi:unnamed protein product [Adineta steineri]|uniref:Uncharacterized protein n=1 Tax=Adineta steineri TaxID=433720 RepID=A0A814CLR0_9BILA|nr:unnamed protein product [Adineta steineri]CAF3686924.1 unnamed protein product [Adineta steineri]
MKAIDHYYDPFDELFHPLWLGILLLFSVIIITGMFCYLRIKCRSQLRNICDRLFENNLSDEKHASASYRYRWPSIYNPVRDESPKLYTLVKNIRTANLKRQLSTKKQNNNEDTNENGIHAGLEIDQSQLPIVRSASISNRRASEIARKFYANMRYTSQFHASLSVDSKNNDSISEPNTPISIVEVPTTSKPEENIRIFRTTRFFQSIPAKDELAVAL